jgi:hypothetical protein
MAQTLARGAFSGACLLLFTALVGCQSGSPQMADRHQPQFNEVPAQPAPPPPQPRVAANPQKISPRPIPQQPVSAPPVATPAMAGIPRDWTPGVASRKWEWIIIHHSATPVGGAVRFGREHQAKGWDELGYDFVIGNGTDTANGLVEVGPRWVKQKIGAHTKTPDNHFNEQGIGICLVGNFDSARPTAAQLQSMSKLVAYLMKTYRIPADHIIGHGDAKATDCPGRNLHIAQVRSLALQTLAAAGQSAPTARLASATAGKELLVENRRQAVR